MASATATEATRQEAQYSTPATKPAQGPKTSRIYEKSPAVPGLAIASSAKTPPIKLAANAATTQPTMEIEPIAPRLAGSRKTPEPIIEPVTTMVARNGPSFFCCVEFMDPFPCFDTSSLQENSLDWRFSFPGPRW